MALFGFGRKQQKTDNVETQHIEYYDLHCHILPGMDDGAKNPDISAAMIDEMIHQGCKGLVATSHYYNKESILQFLERRDEAYQKLVKKLKESSNENLQDFSTHIMLGAEVAYYSNLVNDRDLEKLCFMNPNTGIHTKYLLLEMPFTPWSKNVLRDVSNLIHIRNIVPIIAHLERFYGYTSTDSIEELLALPVIIQSNSGALTHPTGRKRALRMVKEGVTQVLGTDSHNMEQRHPNMEHGIQVLYREGLKEDAKEILNMNRGIYHKMI